MNNSEIVELRPKELEPIPSYILTWDIPLLVNSMCDMKGWNRPENSTYETAQGILVAALEKAFPETPVATIDAGTIISSLQEKVFNAKIAYDLPVVSMDPIYGNAVANFSLNTTRGLNPDQTIEEIPRPGYPPIAEQLDELSAVLGNGREIYLVDAGAYSGDTLLGLINNLKSRDINVNSVFLGIGTTQAERTLWNAGVRPVMVNNIRTPVDWIEARDFIPFVPLCGRVLNESTQKGKLSRAVPYVLPDGNPGDWASIPSAAMENVSIAGWKASYQIISNIESANNIRIALNDLADMPIRVSNPDPNQQYLGTELVRDIIIQKWWSLDPPPEL